MASFRPALTEAPAAHNQAALGTARSIPGRALASSVLDSPCQGSRTGLPPPISTSVPSTPATTVWFASELGIELLPFFNHILRGFRGLELGGSDDGERQASQA